VRLLEIIVAKDQLDKLESIYTEESIIEKWQYDCESDQVAIRLLVKAESSKDLLKKIESVGCRVVILPVEGTLPKVEHKKEKEKIEVGKFLSISKEELYTDISEPVSLSINFILMVVLSSFVAGIGILKDNIAIIIGAMVIAPFLGPNMSMAFGTTLGDFDIIKKSIVTGLTATGIALLISMIWGYTAQDLSLITLDPDIEYQDILLAIICGFAGVLSVLGGKGTTLVGVMVAAALLPPLMRSGLLVGGGKYPEALNSFLIFSTNVICVNIAGIITFYLAGIKPGKWWEQENAKKKTKTAFMIWLIALLLLIAAVIYLKNVLN